MNDGRDLPEVTISEADGVRYLHLGTPWVQGAMRIAAPQLVELEYVQRMLASLLWHELDTLADECAVQLGLGAGAITRFTLRRLNMATTAVELNAQVIAAGRRWFRLPDDGPRLAIVHADAGRWLTAAPPASVRLLHVDLYDHEAAAPVLDDAGFYTACRSVLQPGGTLSVNLFGRDAHFAASAARIAAVFGAAQVVHLRPTREGNTVLVAARDRPPPSRDVIVRRAADIEQRFGLPARKWLRMLRTLPEVPAAAGADAGSDAGHAAASGAAAGGR